MSMLIRSQDKRTLVNLDNTNAILIHEDDTGFSVVACGININYEIGEYSTEEKAIKVLDMIQKQYSHCVAGNIFMNGRIDRVNEMTSEVAECCVREHIDMQVLQMPQDSEV